MGQVLENGYEMKTTFWEDFTIADYFGMDAIKDSYKNAFNSWKHNREYVTELVLVLNWKCWWHYEHDNLEVSKLYSDLYYKLHDWCLDNLKGSDLEYYLEWTD